VNSQKQRTKQHSWSRCSGLDDSDVKETLIFALFGMAVITGLKDSVFGVFYVLHESATQNSVGPWRLRWCVVKYLIDAVQVFAYFKASEIAILIDFTLCRY
jgi:hypothetical protein